MDYETLTLAELRAEFVRLGNELSTVDGERKKINAVIERRVREAAATNRVRAMPPLEREALSKALADFGA